MARKNRKQEDIIRESHERSRKFGINKEQVYPSQILQGEAREAVLRESQHLIEVAGPFLDLLYKFLDGSGFIAVLTNYEGCILRITGDETPVKAAAKLNMVVGAFMNEKSIGTNAMGVAISENAPVQLSSSEHFINAYHQWTCSAAPIHNEDGQIIGTVNLTGSSELVHPHTLGLVVAAVTSIENELQNKLNEQRLKESVRFINTVMDSLSLAVISLDDSGYIRSANKMAHKLLKQPNDSLPGIKFSVILPEWQKYLNMVSSNRIVMDEDINLKTSAGKEDFSMNAYPITLPDGRIDGMVISFREMKRVYKIVNKYMGMNARYTFEDLIGESDELKRVAEYARTVADSPSTVLITGESGTGKEVIAQAMHNYSSRADNGFVALNCGAISPSLIESELFGYDEGAFTGANKGGRPGKFELAHGGTLFLDEIGEMPVEMQVKLLRAIQEGAITRVGGNKQIPVDVRIIAATNKNLKEEIEKGNFRSDLFYRLSVIPIHIQALRERREDIPILIQYFLHLKSVKLKKAVPEIGKQLFIELTHYNWPGNIRELENFIEKFVNLGGDLSFDPNSFSMQTSGNHSPVERETSKSNVVSSLAITEKNAIEQALTIYTNNISHTAKALGISRNALYEKMKRHGITPV
ncbi:MAG: sigma 54-interacting transcriptional regulator [Lentimicrobiaceae bacterium]|nr:sigma 54-interacting transcriptional regulator [Lentimicrobiaceae bacterium]MCB9023007.1 sigma 54-interacting transcriptional regulator [Lentimicrobiaceae bacterium]MCO5266887.1 sigma 54-interacting transcriptional regulator [Lentimicrobium sp.]HPG32260.1 sigma 54-interacting transcriptional regulator [Lentimicrobium sp.]